VSQHSVQLVIGKLLTDADFRQRFEVHTDECLGGLRQRGLDLNEVEIASLVETDPRLWSRMAARMDSHLRRAMSVTSDHANQDRPGLMTERQQRVLSGVCEGLSNKEIAAEEGVSEGAVKATLQQLFRKLHVRRRAQLVRLAIEGALVTRIRR
jgi:DNA-binding NarL/FixJ family response regulator